MNEAGGTSLWSKLQRGQSEDDWEQHIQQEIERLTAGKPDEVKILIPAHQTDLGSRLEAAARFMKAKGYRLHMVAPEDGDMWAAGFERTDAAP